MKITVLGGRGLLGRQLSPLLTNAGHEVTHASRSVYGEGDVRVDLTTGEGLPEAVEDADIVVHLVSDARQPQKTDVAGTRSLLNAMGDQHLIYMSIVGVDKHPLAYYRAKYQVEQMIEGAGRSHAIVRATQFHDFVAYFLGAACKPPVPLIPKRFLFQPIDTREVASHLVELVESGQTGLQPDLAGPEIHTAAYLARSLMVARGRSKPVMNLPVPGKTARAFKQGVHTNKERAIGVRTWADYLRTIAA